ncbi:MAG: hypothetical protein WC553_00065 [Patescibacteria group bacterium]
MKEPSNSLQARGRFNITSRFGNPRGGDVDVLDPSSFDGLGTAADLIAGTRTDNT